MSKFNFKSTIEKVQKSMGKDERRSKQFGVGEALTEISQDPKDYVVLPEELKWKDNFGVIGLQFGKIVQIAGTSDTGKTSLALKAMLAAQEQGIGIIYAETENKTTVQDLTNAGIDPEGVMIVSTGITEEVYDGVFKAWNQFFVDYPKEKLLVIFDSFGNTVSQRDSESDMTTDSQKPGGAAKTNRQGLNTMIARMQTDPVAILVVNYTYDNIGSHGKTNAGGQALNFFTMISIQASRIGWVEAVRQGKKVRLGAKVSWKVFKNHYAKSIVDENGKQILLSPEVQYSITAEGFKVLDSKDKE